jgi:GTP pyrophosphokinase
VFTPKGDVRVFPRGATPIDFAYAIHTEVGQHCSGARVNGAIVPLRSKLRNGDVVEVMTNPNQHPSKDWLDYVSTSRARSKIRAFLRTEQREKSLKLGRELLEKDMHQRSMSLSRLAKNEAEMRRVIERFGVSSADELFVGVGYGKVSARAICDFLAPKEDDKSTSSPPDSIKEGRIESLVRKVTGKASQGIRLNGIDDVLVRYTKCCNPLPGDEIIGFITRGRGITVHRRNCPKALDTDPERRVEISWDSRAKINRPVSIRVMTANRPGILATVGHTFHEQGINISEATCRASDDGRAMNTFTFLCSDLAQLKSVIRQLQRIPGVMAVERT